MSELSKEGTDIKALFDEADIWLPSPLPAGGKYVDLQKIQHTPSYIDELLDELIEQMKRSDAKINAVADLLYDKYLGTFLPLLPPNTDPKDFKQVFITMFRATRIAGGAGRRGPRFGRQLPDRAQSPGCNLRHR
ncbi:MAG: hypothetical protein ACLRM8_07310 [Alistipes sp.]